MQNLFYFSAAGRLIIESYEFCNILLGEKNYNDKVMKHLLLMMVLLMPVVAMAYDFEVDGIYYMIDGDEVAVTCRSSLGGTYNGDVVIPATVTYDETTYPVTSICSDAFYKCGGMTSIAIPNTVTEIGYAAFNLCNGLTSVHITDLEAWLGITFSNFDANPLSYAGHLVLNGETVTDLVVPGSVTAIHDWAFEGCTDLTSVTIHDGVTAIGNGAFINCTELTRADLGNTVTWIGDDAFLGCLALMGIDIPNTVTYIGYEAFCDCYALATVTIGDHVQEIGDFAFSNCTSLMGINIPHSVTYIAFGAFSGCSSLSELTIPNSVTYIGPVAFSTCSSLTSVTIPNSLTSLSDGIFSGCSALASVIIPSSVTTIGEWAFDGCSAMTTIHCWALEPPTAFPTTFSDCYGAVLYVHADAVEAYRQTDYWKDFAMIQAVPPAGDVDGDGKVNIDDVAILIDSILLGSTDAINIDSADLNINGRLDIDDVTILIDFLLGS